jgi:hypothetical protein
MKSLTSYLKENKKNYSFKICIAGELPEDAAEKMRLAVDAYKVESMSKPKSLPIQRDNPEFPTLGAVEIHCVDLVAEYPATPAEVKAQLVGTCGIPATHINVKTALEAGSTNLPPEDTKGALLLNPELAAEDAAGLYTDAQVETLLKELTSMAMEFASPNKERAKTTNDLPQGVQSTMGNIKPKLPEVKSAAR